MVEFVAGEIVLTCGDEHLSFTPERLEAFLVLLLAQKQGPIEYSPGLAAQVNSRAQLWFEHFNSHTAFGITKRK